jgi:glycosyltransferase 2 family protein
MLRSLSVDGFSLTRLRLDIWRLTGLRGCQLWAAVVIGPASGLPPICTSAERWVQVVQPPPAPATAPPNPALTLSEPTCYGAQSMLRRLRRYLLLLLAVLALGFFFYKFRNSISLEGFHWGMVGQSLREARISLLLLAVAAIYVCYAIRALRWMRFSRTLGHSNFAKVYSATLMGFACTFLLGRAGEPIRPVLIAKKNSLSIPGMFGVYVLERVSDMAATVVLAGVALLIFQGRGLVGGEDDPVMKVARSAGVLLLVLLVGLISFLVYFRYHGGQWLARKLKEPAWRTGWRSKLALLLEGFSEGLQGIRTWSDLGALAAYTAVHWILVVFIYFWVAHAFGGDLADIDLTGAVLTLAFTMVGSAAQLPGVGGGAQLATFLVFTLIFGVEKEPAAAASIILWLVTFASVCLVGVPLLFREGWSMGELKRMASAGAEEAKAEEAEQLSKISKEITSEKQKEIRR